jgi:SAM-dependent methyltransferase
MDHERRSDALHGVRSLAQQTAQAGDVYDRFYFQRRCGRPYQRDEAWLSFFDGIARRIVQDIGPKTVLDAGCAVGFLVEALRRRGVDAFGIDLSEHAIAGIHADIAAYCRRGSVTDPLPQRYDLIVCIEVLQHLSAGDAERAVENLCRHSDDVLFASSPFDFKEPTHCNVQPPEHWARMFARHGFVRDLEFDASFITLWARRFRRASQPLAVGLAEYERRLWRLEQENRALREAAVEQRQETGALGQEIESLRGRLPAFERAVQALTAHRQTGNLAPPQRGHVLQRAYSYWKIHGFRALVSRGGEFLSARGGLSAAPGARSTQPSPPRPLDHAVRERFETLQPLRAFAIPRVARPRVNLVTDSINKGSLFGGVGTAIVFSALLAERLNCALRVITRTERADERNFGEVLESNGISWRRNVEFTYADFGDTRVQVEIGDKDLFVTTSWWTTWVVRETVGEDRIIYLLQEDERMFYPYGDDHLRCTEILKSSGMRFVVNSWFLYDHLVAEGFSNIEARGRWFEPSFPEGTSPAEDPAPDGKENFFFYARPNNLRNLFYLGLDVIDRAVSSRVLDLDRWELFFVGKDLPSLTVGSSYRPQLIENLSWGEYVTLVRRMALGLCLMYSPHPSYPPLDLAARGAVVVTNRFGNKRDLSMYSRNILCRDPDVGSLVQAVAEGVRLVGDLNERTRNFRESVFLRDWSVSFDGVLDWLGGSE